MNTNNHAFFEYPLNHSDELVLAAVKLMVWHILIFEHNDFGNKLHAELIEFSKLNTLEIICDTNERLIILDTKNVDYAKRSIKIFTEEDLRNF